MRMVLLMFVSVAISGLMFGQYANAENGRHSVTEILLLERQGKLEEAANVLRPCLDGTAPFLSPEMEECLYIGERVMNSLFAKLLEQTHNEKEFIKALDGLGLKYEMGHYSGPYYTHEYFRTLARKFPESKYSEEFEYILLNDQKAGVGVAPWEVQLDGLNAYLRNHPKGPYLRAAQFDVGCIYASLWSLLRPDTSEAGYRDAAGLSSGSLEKDKARALRYRKLAIKAYEAGLTYNAKYSRGVSEQMLQDATDTLKALRTNGEAGVGCVISD